MCELLAIDIASRSKPVAFCDVRNRQHEEENNKKLACRQNLEHNFMLNAVVTCIPSIVKLAKLIEVRSKSFLFFK